MGTVRERRAPSGAPRATTAPPVVAAVVRRTGTPLAPAVRQEFEQRLGHDFSAVRIHSDDEATRATTAVGARAYTLGRHIAIRNGLYNPSTTEGRRLLTHELVHVAQQASFGDHQLVGAPVLTADHPSERQARTGHRATPPLAAPAVQCDRGQPLFLGPRPVVVPPRSLTTQLNPDELSIGALEQEIRLIKEWLAEETFSPGGNMLTFTLAGLQSALARKQREQRERSAREQRSQERVRKKWERYPVEKIDEEIHRITSELMGQGRYLEIPKAIEPLKRERARRRDARRARPVTAPRTVAEAIGQLQEAWRDAEKEDVPDWERSVALVAGVDDWLQRLHLDWREHFPGISGMTLTSTGLILGHAVTGVRQLRLMQSYGPGPLGGRWEYAINAVRYATESLEILGNERSLESAPIQRLAQTEGRILKYEAAGYAAIPAIPGLIAAGIAAAPEVASAGFTWAAANPLLAHELVFAGTATGLELAETGTVDPWSLMFNLLHVQAARGGGGGGPRSGAGSEPDVPAPAPRGTPVPRTPAVGPPPLPEPPQPSPPPPTRAPVSTGPMGGKLALWLKLRTAEVGRSTGSAMAGANQALELPGIGAGGAARPTPALVTPRSAPDVSAATPDASVTPDAPRTLATARPTSTPRTSPAATTPVRAPVRAPVAAPTSARPATGVADPSGRARVPARSPATSAATRPTPKRTDKAPLSSLTVRQLQNRAQDPDAAEELRLRFRQMSDQDLKKAMASDRTGIARMVYDSRIPPNVKLAELQGKRGDLRPVKHEASARVVGTDGRERWSSDYRSGGVTAAQREEHGWREASRMSHTERQAINAANLAPGERLEITGQYDPCPWCQQAMRQASLGGRVVEYWWPGGRFVAADGFVTWTYLR